MARGEIQKFFRNKFTRNVATLFSGSAIAQVLPYFISMVLARIYSVAEQGIYAQVNSVMQVLSTGADGRYGQAVVLPKEDVKARNLVVVGLYFTGAFSVVVLIGIYFFEDFLKGLFNNSVIGNLFFVTPVFVLLVGAQRTFNFWLIRKEAYRMLAISKVVQTTAGSLFMLLFGIIGLHGGWLLGYVAGWAVFTIVSYLMAARKGLLLNLKNNEELKEEAVEYKEFPVYYGIPYMLVEFSKQATIFLTAILYSLEDTGYYNFTRMMILAPLTIFGVALGQVYFQRLALRHQERESVVGSVARMAAILTGIAVIFILLFGFFGEEIMVFFFSDKWRVSGQLSQVLIFSFALQFVVIPLNNLLPAIKEMKLAAVYPSLYFVAILALFFFDYSSFYEFIVYLTVVEVSVFLIFGITVLLAVNKYERIIKNEL